MVPMVGASGAISAVIGAYALSFGRAKPLTRNLMLNRWINVAWLLVAWVGLQLMTGYLAGAQGYLLATPADVGGFAAGLLLQRPLLLWRYRKASTRLRSLRCGRNTPAAVRFQQPVEVDDDIFHFGIVDRRLRLAAPRFLGGGIAVVDADQVDAGEVGELEALRVLDPPAEDQVELAHLGPLARGIERGVGRGARPRR